VAHEPSVARGVCSVCHAFSCRPAP